MKVCEYSSQGQFLALAKGHLPMKIETYFSQKPLDHFNQIVYVSFMYKEMKIYEYDVVHMTKMAAKHISGKKKPSKIFSGTDNNNNNNVFILRG